MACRSYFQHSPLGKSECRAERRPEPSLRLSAFEPSEGYDCVLCIATVMFPSPSATRARFALPKPAATIKTMLKLGHFRNVFAFALGVGFALNILHGQVALSTVD